MADAKATDNQAQQEQNGQKGTVRVTWVRSGIGYSKSQKATIKALGLHRLHESVDLPDNPAVRGQIFKVKHMLEVEES